MFVNGIVYLIFFGLGAGVGFFVVDTTRAIILTISAVILIGIGFFMNCSCNFDVSNMMGGWLGFYETLMYTLGYIPSAFVFFFLMFPITLSRDKLANLISICIAIIYLLLYLLLK